MTEGEWKVWKEFTEKMMPELLWDYFSAGVFTGFILSCLFFMLLSILRG